MGKRNGQPDFLIVGQGLAGTCLSHTLKQRGQNILVIDQDAGERCSKVAAGTFNPVAFRVLSTTWRAGEFVPFLKTFFSQMEEYLSCSLLQEIPVYKVLKSEAEATDWITKAEDGPLNGWVSNKIIKQYKGLHSPDGIGRVIQSGKINIPQMISRFRETLIDDHSLLEEEFDHSGLRFYSDGVKYKGYRARRLIYCEGFSIGNNPFFNHLPIQPNKGEVLIVRCPGLQPKAIFHNRINIVPLEPRMFWVGATFNPKEIQPVSTEAGKKELLLRLKQTLSVDFEVIEHWSGIRPTSIDRRPLIGMHQEHNQIGMFNGMGTRGVMLAPFWADHFANHLLSDGVLDPEVDIARFNE